MKRIISISILILFVFQVQGQERKSPKRIKVSGNYIHSETETSFPEQFENYNRTDIYSFDKKDKNIGVTYELETNDKKTTISIYLYPTEEASEGRLKNEYFNSMQSIANFSKNGINATQKLIRKVGEKYICNGIKAEMKNDKNELTHLSLFECGTWFYKIRLTTNELDSIQAENIEKKIIEKFDPTRLSGIKKLNTKANVYFSKNAFCDSIMLGSTMGSAFKKINWALENVKENERASGFPDLYIDMHIESIKELLKFQDKYKYKKTQTTIEYLDELKSIVESGFINEFLMEQYDMLLIIPDERKFNFDAYKKWKENKKLAIDLNKRYYVISYKKE
ncbi:hypothetical protein [Flavobacterium aquicola]|uniref:Uncharacterized protein n=1 Tax=Flavobacterium aquicola TaxID=1682742 RepID=A0A3E0ELF2_9FLAO|nr:hypothetical protein [Flavobacterium aquicola]REG98149.1 hypothetical protein C8P67_10773 [Flavobacterium aquicola]